MSAPNTNIEKQAKQHRGPLRGMLAAVLFALTLLVILLFFVFGRGGDPEGSTVQVEGTTGQVEGVEAGAEGADPAAVTVPAETVETPQTGTDATINPTTGASETAEPATADE